MKAIMPNSFAFMISVSFLGTVAGQTFLQYPSAPVVASLGTSLSLTCVVGCRTPLCQVWWTRATSTNGKRRQFLPVSHRHWLKEGLAYPTYAHRDTRNMQVRLKLIIQKVTLDHYGVYECQAAEFQNDTRRAGPIQLQAPSFILPNTVKMPGAENSSPLATAKCQVPIIHDIKVTVNRKVDEDGALCLDVMWRRDPIQHRKLCKVSTFEMWYASWNSSQDVPTSDFADSDTSTANFHWIKHSAVPLTASKTTVCGLKSTHHHQLQFRVASLNKKIMFNSHIYYFGDQTAAVVLNSVRHIRVQHGMNFTIPCQVGGEPCPKALFAAVITGNPVPGPALHPYSNPSDHPPDITFWHNRTVNTKSYPKHFTFTVKCIASNMIVNPPEGVIFKYSTWNTRITIHP